MKHKIGIMQGRLTQPNGRGIQFFPFDNWENEFYAAQEIGLDEIEFIFDYDRYEENPLWTDTGIDRIKKHMDETGVAVRSVCFDYFMRRSFYKAEADARDFVKQENTKVVERTLSGMAKLGITLIEIPLVDASSLQNECEKEGFREWFRCIVNNADEGIKFALETDMNPNDFLEYLNGFDDSRVGANYDSGNSSGMGYDAYEEVTVLRDYILNIHIKDRIYRGTTVRLGAGNADFDRLFKGLKEIGYKHNFILQAARGDDGKEKENIMLQKRFVEDYIVKYGV